MQQAQISPERAADVDGIRVVHRAAFPTGAEGELVDRLRASDAFIPELSLVAERAGRIVGHILLTRVVAESPEGAAPALALAPMAVLPNWQRRGVGAALVRRALDDARSLGHALVIVLGHPEYYPRFGFTSASAFGIAPPFDAPDEAFMALWLDESQARSLHATVRYSSAFGL